MQRRIPVTSGRPCASGLTDGSRAKEFVAEARRLVDLLDPDSAEVRLLALLDAATERERGLVARIEARTKRHDIGTMTCTCKKCRKLRALIPQKEPTK